MRLGVAVVLCASSLASASTVYVLADNGVVNIPSRPQHYFSFTPEDVNSSGVIVGNTEHPGFTYDHGVWTQMPGFAFAVNDAGQVAGELSNGHAYRYDPATLTTHDLGTSSVLALGLSPNGKVVGYGEAPTGGTAFYSDGTSPAISLGLPAGFHQSYANAVNDSGTVGGGAYHQDGTSQAFTWDGTFHMLPAPGEVTAISPDGLILAGTIGSRLTPNASWSYNVTTGEYAIVTFTDYSLGITPTLILHAADDGTLSGWGIDRSSGRHLITLTPVPEPAALAMLLPVGTLILRRRSL